MVDKPRKYKYKALSISKEDVLFLLLNILEIDHLQAIDFSLS
ncbi:MAG: hypothetical protein AB7V56_14610 [Candidatus Nitrosocosmicus sp.]